MSGTEAVLREVAAATRMQLPLGFSWFRRPGPVTSPELGAALGTEQARSYLRVALQYHLYRHFYCQGRPTVMRAPTPSDVVAADLFVDQLSTANSGVGAWQEGWDLELVLDSGEAVASRHRLTVRVDENEWRRSTRADPALRNAIALRLGKESPGRQPNFYIALSDLDFDADRTDGLVRIYWNISPEGAPSLVRHLTTLLNRAEIPFGLKLVNDPIAYDRCDSAVLYLHRESWVDAVPVLTRTHASLLPSLRQVVPAFAKRLGVGLGFAEDPPDSESFGLTRCGTVAEGLLRAAEADRDSVDERVQAILDCFTEEGIDPDRPYLNPGSADGYHLSASTHVSGATPDARADHVPDRAAEKSVEEFGCAAEQIAVQLCRNAVWHEQRCNWIGADPVAVNGTGLPARRWTGLDSSLYSGTAGVAAFLARVAVLRGAETRETALGAARHAVRRAADLAPGHLLGLYTGGLGTALAVAHVGQLLDEPGLVDAAAELTNRCLSGRPSIRERDVLGGDAGAIVALLALQELLDDESIGNAAEEITREMLAAANHDGNVLCWPSAGGPALTGFSHGSAGMAWALYELDSRRPDMEWRSAARAVERFEREWFDAAAGNWRDRRELPGTEDFMTAWCHGAPGVVLSRLCVSGGAERREQAAENDAGLATTRRWLRQALLEEPRDYSLCHGLAGVADTMLQIGRQTGNLDDVGLAMAVGDFGLQRYASPNRSWPCGTPSGETPALMLGLSGIGWFFLRLFDPQVPCLLLPRPDSWRPGAGDTAAAQRTAPEQVRVRAALPADQISPPWVGYGGQLTGDDLGALVRLHLAAGGFRPPTADHPGIAARWAVGLPLRDRFLPSQFLEYADVVDFLALPDADPYLWNSLPLMLAFGHEQAQALLAVAGERDPDGAASRISALFSALLSTFDYVADETPHRAAVYSVEPAGLAALSGGDSAADDLRRAYQEQRAPAVRLVCVLFQALATALHAAEANAGDPDALEMLRSRIRRLFAAERASTLGRPGTAREFRELGQASLEKSVLPFDVLLRLACLVATGRAPSGSAASTAAALGRAICLADDLVDLLTDLERGAPSPLVIALFEQAQGSSDPSAVDDQALLAVVANATAELMAELASDALVDQASGLRSFAHRSVARWVGWHDELDSQAAASAAALTVPMLTSALSGHLVSGKALPALDQAMMLLGEPGLAAILRDRLGTTAPVWTATASQDRSC